MIKEDMIPALVTAIAALIGLIWQYFGVIVDLKERTSALETKMELFWNAVGKYVTNMLKQPIHLRKDDLLDRFETLKDEELIELKDTLMNEIKELNPKNPLALAYVLVLSRIDQMIYERTKMKIKSGDNFSESKDDLLSKSKLSWWRKFIC